MSLDDIDRVTVLGAGNMGHGITEVVAIAGYEVTMRDIEQDLVDDGYESIQWSLEKLSEKGLIDEDPEDVMSRVSTEVDLETAVEDADLVIEAAPEQMSLKKDIFGDLDEFTHEDCILASNTSSLSITEIATATSRPEKVCGMHFFNPPVKMDLVEVIYGEETSDETAETVYEFTEAIGKTPIYVRKDVNGFVVNSVLGPFGDEAGWIVSAGEATIREVDATMVHERGYPMGPFELGDLTGIDIGYHVRKEAGKDVPPIVEEKVEAEELGQKTGKGYYDYEDGDGADYGPDDVSGEFDWLRIEARIINEAAKLIGNDVATPEAIDTGLRLGAGFPEGPCRRADKLGLDTVLEKLQEQHEATGEERYEPADYLVDLVEAGKTGEDAGEGFYEYGGDDGERDYQTLNTTLTEDGLLEIELDRPERLNALNADLMDEIVHVLDHADMDAVRAVSFEGTGDRAFCAGADITGFAGMDPADVDVTPVFQTVNDFPRPTLAKIQGFCLGGGLELALACDLRIATEDSEFGFPEINLGLIPGGGGTQRAMRMLTEARAKELVFRGEHISAERAENWGLVNRCVTDEEFEDTVDEFLEDLVHGAPIALRKAKEVMNEGRDQDIGAGLVMESQAFGLLLTTDDMMEGASAFMEKRDPEFEGK
ncbi:3-hydroxyacyl-CoA dehydrogenase NAD-binding domain-containing protein [Salinirubellus salinus]|uniref:3-hydroxyacyl-CoA dehydrogenase NAD-binding domain-containing protein n=1 Tax=Salinirubellus salinus TaxID=1364945 RepID=A0A9E7R4D3_9EURY|nr:3-hydroxyacyl-CoA dehydrogenase NAD-binding domain-containing protein [Salinirubellus salinus]UWM55327.1 3-hydroxyacyl-CoA dehydrogenase NAD-binding domain-containing protein [Salinirubellus salinus]